jgi:hypothetical protein
MVYQAMMLSHCPGFNSLCVQFLQCQAGPTQGANITLNAVTACLSGDSDLSTTIFSLHLINCIFVAKIYSIFSTAL